MKRKLPLTLLSCFLFLNTIWSQNASTQGQWSAPIEFGIVPVAVANLPDGRLLCWSSQFRNTFIEYGDGATFSQYFDPFGGVDGKGGVDGAEFTINTDHDMFCPGINNLADGRLLSAGGTTSERTSIFDPQTGIWSVASEMNIPRGYQGNVTLQDGTVFTVGGSWSNGNSNNPNDPFRNGGKDAELWSPLTGWITLNNIQGEDIYTAADLASEDQGLYRVDNHVWLWPAPNGKLFHAGPSEMMHWIDVDVPNGLIVDAGIRQDLGQNKVDGYSMKGNTVMFDVGKILKTGGAPEYGDDHLNGKPAREGSFIIDLNGVSFGNTPNVTFAGNMGAARTMHNSTVLPNGEVLVTGGIESAEVFQDLGAVMGAEIYNENTGWRNVATMNEPRTYHSVAILMVDGRVFVGGGGLCDGSNPGCVNHFDAEIYSPPYLFDNSGNLATRPQITGISSGNANGPYNETVVDYNSTLTVNTNTNVTEFSLIRFSAATHATNNEQRRIPLNTVSGTSHSLSIPDRNLLPPGYYMLFALDANGTPSIAEVLKIGDAIPLSSNPNLVLDMKFDENSGASLSDDSANNNDGTVVEREDDGTPRTADDHQFSTGVFGNAIEFDGKEHTSNSLIDIPYDTSFETAQSQITLSAWVWRDTGSAIPQAGGKIANVGVVSHHYPNIFFGFHNTLYKWSFSTTNGYVDCYSGYAPLEGWNHIVATFDGEFARIYANGVEIAKNAATGMINLVDSGDRSSFTVSGFYEHREFHEFPVSIQAYANMSKITDEVDGKIDELKIYNVALGAEEISQLYQLGVATGNPDIPDCSGNEITVEYKLYDSASSTWGDWVTSTNKRILAKEGDELFIRAKDYSGQYFVTTQRMDGPTFDSNDFSNPENAYKLDTGIYGNADDGILGVSDSGIYVLTTENGCPTPIELRVLGSCDPGETVINTQYQINGVWQSGANSLSLDEGTKLVLSAIPDDPSLEITITLPNGVNVPDNYEIESLDPLSHQGEYLIMSNQGCSQILELTINDVDCNTLPLETEYQINSTPWVSGQNSVSVDIGSNLNLSIAPNGIPYSIVSNAANQNGKSNGTDDLLLTNITADDAGTYTFTTASGCSTTLEVSVNVSCAALNPQIEYQINAEGSFTQTGNTLSLDEGNNLELRLSPAGTSYQVTSNAANGNAKTMDTQSLTLNNVTSQDSGTYTFTTDSGCTETLNLTINTVGCNALNFRIEHNINDSGFIEGSSFVRVLPGDKLVISGLPNQNNGSPLAYTVNGPNSNNKPLNSSDLTINNIQNADGGTYELVSSSGCSSNIEVIVGANAAPTANTSASTLSGTAPLDVDFTGSGSTDDLAISSYQWNFGDGNTSNQADPTHQFINPGTYTVVLTVTDNEGAQDTEQLTIDVEAPNQAPNAVIQADILSGQAPLTINFNGTDSTDDEGINAYAWNFGNGNTENGEQVSHTFTTGGTFEVILTVTDTEGVEDSASVTINVAPPNNPPTAIIETNTTNGNAPLTVAFTGDLSTDDAGITTYLWDFGNGNTSNEPNPNHTFTESGNFTVNLTVTDTQGASDSDNVVISVGEVPNTPPLAQITVDNETGVAPLSVQFNSDSSTDDKGIVSYAWDFGNGQSSTDSNPAMIFSEPGTYTVKLTVWDQEDLSDSDTQTIVVDPVPNTAPVAVISSDKSEGEAPLTVQFSSSDSYDDKEIVSQTWDFGNGETSQQINATITFETPGEYTVSLTVSDAEGLSNTTQTSITVNLPEDNTPPVAKITSSTTSGIAPLAIAFDAGQSSDNIGITTYAWDFGDGTNSSESALNKTYAQAGQYTVVLTVTDANGNTDSDQIVITVSEMENTAPIAMAQATPLTGLAPLNVSFSSEGSYDDAGIQNYNWDFGDGTTSQDQNPTHLYTESGTFQAILTVSDAEGLTDTYNLTIVVNAPENMAPVAQITANGASGKVPLTVTFSSEGSTDDIGITNYSWDFGTGDTSSEENPQYTFTQVGTYEVVLTVTDEAGLSSTASFTITVNPNTNGNTIVQIAPNPVSGNVAHAYISYGNDTEPTKLGVYDSTGKLIYTFTPKDVLESGRYNIPLNNLVSGIYYLKVYFSNAPSKATRILVR
ncbi:PKD domain-containing protein [Sediminicola luteus]|nr:PKD domain-containing protein [Sediminicola luteus]